MFPYKGICLSGYSSLPTAEALCIKPVVWEAATSKWVKTQLILQNLTLLLFGILFDGVLKDKTEVFIHVWTMSIILTYCEERGGR